MKLEAVANKEQVYQNAVNKEGTGSGAYAVGQILEGQVTEAGDQVTIDFSGRSLTFSKESVPGAEKGQMRRFQVTQANAKGITLKEIGTNGQKPSAKIMFTQVDSGQHAVLWQEAKEAEEEEEEDPKDVSDRMTAEDYEALEKEGYTLEGYNLTRLERALARIKEGREWKEEAIANLQEKTVRTREEIRKVAAGVLKNQSAAAEYLAELFARADIPVTSDKIQNILKAEECGTEVIGSGLSSSAKAYMIGNELEPSIENLYKAAHSGGKKTQELSEKVWDTLKSSAENVLAEAGREADAAGLADAKWLLENELPLTAENLIFKAELDALPEQVSREDVLEKAVQAVSEGKDAKEALLAQGSKELAARAEADACRRDFALISPGTVDHAVQRLLAEGKDVETELSLSFLKRLESEMAGMRPDAAIRDVTARRQLEQIRLKLTTEAGARLLSQGIRLDTDGLSKIVEGLQRIEREYYQKLYQEAGGEVTDEADGKVALLKEASEMLEGLKRAPAYVLGVTFSNRFQETLPGLERAAGVLTETLRRAGEGYEALMTKPRADMGDSIQEAFRSVDGLLADMGLEATEANRRAVRILSYNHMELTQENLVEMKLYDAKVNELFHNMNPAACAALIKEGVNPLDMPVEDLNKEMVRLREEEGATTEEKFSNYLVKLDQKKELSKEERESYIGIFRLLHQVTKTDGAALGAVVCAGREVTLASLLSAVRTRKKGGVDAAVDDEFGGLEGISRREAGISEQIGAAFRYQQILAERLIDSLTPERFVQAGQGSDKPAEEMSLESLQEAVQQAEGTKGAAEESLQYAQAKLAALAETAYGSKEEQAFLSAFGQETSFATLQAAKELLSSRSIKDSIRALAGKYGMAALEEEMDPDRMENAENMLEMVEEWTDLADKAIDGLFESASLTGEDSQRLIVLRNTIRLAKGLAKREFYEVPLRGENGFIKLNLTVVHSGASKGSVSIRMKGEAGEGAAFDLKISNKSLNCYILSSSRTEMEQLKQQEAMMKNALKEQGFEITQWNYGLGTRSVDSENFRAGDGAQREKEESGVTRMDDLYLAAKTIIKTVAGRA